MDQQQVNRILDAIRALDSKVDLLKQEFDSRSGHMESRVANIESAIIRLAGPNALPAVPAVPSFPMPPSIYQSVPRPPPAVYGSPMPSHGYVQPPLPAPKAVGSKDNASYLPYAIEHIGDSLQRKRVDDKRKCSVCGAPTFSIDCFRNDHFQWCRVHQRPVLKPHYKCGREYDGCIQVKWEHHPGWEGLVQQSYASGYLGRKGVEGLDEMLFPRDLYPERYNGRGW